MNVQTGRPTIRQVAAAAGVSTQTVSRVINDRPDVSHETRRRVQRIIDDLGYQPSALARSLIQQRSYTLGVVTAGLRHIGPSRTLGGITATAADAGYALLLEELPRYDTDEIVPMFQSLRSRHVDGVIWAVPEVGDNRRWINRLPAQFDTSNCLSGHGATPECLSSLDQQLSRCPARHGPFAGAGFPPYCTPRWPARLVGGPTAHGGLEGRAAGIWAGCSGRILVGRHMVISKRGRGHRETLQAIPENGRHLCCKRPDGAERIACRLAAWAACSRRLGSSRI